jgi:Protein of unknown function (DUF3800)
MSDSRSRNPGSTGSLALALFHRWEPQRLFVIVTVYIDESGTHGSPVTILAGWVGRLRQWANFDQQWRRLLKRNGLTYFRSKDMKDSHGEFKGWTINQKKQFSDIAAKLATKHLEFGFSITLREDDYRQHYINGYRPREVPVDSRYGLCFRYCLGLVSNLAMQAFDRHTLEISFVLEDGANNLGDAGRIFNRVTKSRIPREQQIVQSLKTLTIGKKAEFPGLQMADVIAYNSFHHTTKKPFPTITLDSTDSNYLASAKKKDRTPVLHMPLVAAELRRFKQFILDEIEEKQARRKKSISSSACAVEQSS